MKGEVPGRFTPEQEPRQIRQVNRLFLPALRLISDEQRISVIETLATSNSFMRPSEIQRAIHIPASTFFKFAAEFGRSGLLSNREQGEVVDSWTEETISKEISGVYRLTPYGRYIFKSLFELGERVKPLMGDFVTPRLVELGFKGKQLEEARTIYLAFGDIETSEGEVETQRVNRLLLPRLRLLSEEGRLSIIEFLADQSSYMPPQEIIRRIKIASSSLFKFSGELQKAGLLDRPMIGYHITPIAKEILRSLIDLGEHLVPLFVDIIAIDLARKGVENDKLEEIRAILLLP